MPTSRSRATPPTAGAGTRGTSTPGCSRPRAPRPAPRSSAAATRSSRRRPSWRWTWASTRRGSAPSASVPRADRATMSSTRQTLALRGRTAWVRNLAAPVRDFLSNETGGAMVMLGAALLALLWANSPWRDTYESLWTTRVSLSIGDGGIALDLRHVVNQGLMTFFFLVVGLEAKRELDRGELRERRRITIPAAAAA